MLHPPVAHLVDNRFDGFTAVSQGVLDSEGLLADDGPIDERLVLEILEAVREYLLGDAVDLYLQSVEPQGPLSSSRWTMTGCHFLADKRGRRGERTPILTGTPDGELLGLLAHTRGVRLSMI